MSEKRNAGFPSRRDLETASGKWSESDRRAAIQFVLLLFITFASGNGRTALHACDAGETSRKLQTTNPPKNGEPSTTSQTAAPLPTC